MIITAVERAPTGRGRVAVDVDGVSTFEVGQELARAHSLTPGRVIEGGEVDAIVTADQERIALTAAVAMLARRPRSEREVRLGLARRKCEAAAIEEAVRKLRSAGLIDDADYARAWTEARDRFSPRGRRLIVQELRRSGVAPEIAHAAAAEVSEEAAAMRAASRRVRGLGRLEYQAFLNKLGAYLQRRGFAWETCRTTVDACWGEMHDGAAVEDTAPE